MQKLKKAETLSRQALKLLSGKGPGGNNNPPKGGNAWYPECGGLEPLECDSPEWIAWRACVGNRPFISRCV